MTVLPFEKPAASPLRRPSAPPPPAGSFAALGVPPPLLAALAEAGINSPFPIQAATLRDTLAGRDVLGRGRTGSGKTLAFAIPLVATLADGFSLACRPRGLVLVPTRELASQVRAVIEPLASAMDLTVVTVFGGTPQSAQVAGLRDRADIVVACPGRLADLLDQGHCHLGDVEVSVLDEADHMSDLGFLPIVRRLLDATPAEGQRMLFSATLDNDVAVLVRRFLSDPAEHSADPGPSSSPMVHHVLTVSPSDRVGVVAALAAGQGRALIFTRTRRGAVRLARELTAARIQVTELHGDLAQGVRERNLASFAAGSVKTLVATDIAARGIHVDGIDLVIHADPPAEHKAYVHRSGRTARAGAAGTAVTVQTSAQAREVTAMMRKASVEPLRASVRPDSALLRSIAGPRATRQTRLASPAPLPVASAAPATGHSAAAMSAGFRGSRRR